MTIILNGCWIEIHKDRSLGQFSNDQNLYHYSYRREFSQKRKDIQIQ